MLYDCHIYIIRTKRVNHSMNNLLTRHHPALMLIQRLVHLAVTRTFSPKHLHVLAFLVNFGRTPRSTFLKHTRIVFLSIPYKWEYARDFRGITSFYNTFSSVIAVVISGSIGCYNAMIMI